MCLFLHVKLVLRWCKSQCQREQHHLCQRTTPHSLNKWSKCLSSSLPCSLDTEGFQPLGTCSAARLNCGKWGRRPVNNSCHDAPQLLPHCHPNACPRRQRPASTISALNTWLGAWQVLIFLHRGLVHLNKAAALAIIILTETHPHLRLIM